MYQFEKLEVWNIGLDLVDQLYKLNKKLPDDEKFGLTSQLRRAIISVVLNIAEGRGAGTDPEFKRFLNISLRSLFEIVAGLKVAIKLGYLSEGDCYDFFKQSDECGSKITGLIKYLKKQTTNGKRLTTS